MNDEDEEIKNDELENARDQLLDDLRDMDETTFEHLYEMTKDEAAKRWGITR
jgi:hypothetical protein